MTSAITLSPSASSVPQTAVAARPHAAAAVAAAETRPDASGPATNAGTADGASAPTGVGAASGAPGSDKAEVPGSFGATLDRLRAGTATRLTAKSGTDATVVTDAPAAAAKPHTDEEVPDDALLLTAWMGPSLEAARLASAMNAPAAGSPVPSAADAATDAIGEGASGRAVRELLASQAAAAPPALADQAVVAAVASAAPAILKALTGTSGAPSATEPAAPSAAAKVAPAPYAPSAGTTTAAGINAIEVSTLSPTPSASVATASAASITANTTNLQTANAALPAPALADAAEKNLPMATALAATASQAVRPANRSDGSDADADTLGTSTPLSAPNGATPIAQGASPGASTDAIARPAIAPEVGSDAWGPALGQQMIRIAAKGDRVAELELNPIGLGPLKVRLAVNDNQAQAMFMSGHESVRQAVEAALPQLRTTLASHGISLGQTSVGADPGQAFFAGTGAERDPSQQQQHPQQHGTRAAAFAGRTDTPEPALIELPQVMRPLRSGTGFTTFA